MMADEVKDDSKKFPEQSLSFRFCQFIVNRNLLAFSLAILAQTSFPLITAVLYFGDSDVLPIDFTDIPLILFDEPSYRRAAAWTSRNRDSNEPIVLDPSFLNDTELRHQLLYRQNTADYIELYYEIGDGDHSAINSDTEATNILTATYLTQIAEFESSLLRLPYFDRYCLLRRLGECEPVDSLIQYLPFLTNDKEDNFSNSRSNFSSLNEEIWQSINTLSRDPDRGAIIANYFALDAKIESYPPRASKLRSILRASWLSYDPHVRLEPADNQSSFENVIDNSSIPAAYDAKAFIKDVLSPALWNYCLSGIPGSNGTESTKPIRFFYYNIFLYYDRLQIQCWRDEAYALGSLSFIFLFLWFQTRSLFLAIFGMYFILTNFVGGNLLYRYVFDFRYVGLFNALAIFLVLAVGVDEIFVFEETWSATGEKSYPSLAHRLYECYQKCSLSILVPTLATTIALIQTALCPLMALSCFGAFAACVIVLNYLSIVSYFPCVLVFYHCRIDSNCRYRQRKIDSIGGNSNSTGRAQRISQKACTAYCALLWKPSVQAVLLMLTALGLGFLTYSATNVSVDKEPPKLYTESHPLGASLKRRDDYPKPLHNLDSQFVKLYLVWGIKDWDRSRCHRTEWKTCDARIVWDDSFDLNPFPAQLDMLNICRRLRNLPRQQVEDLMIRTTKNGSNLEIGCFMEEMDSYFHKEMRSLLYEEHNHLSGLPATQVKVEALMLHVPQIYNITEILQNPFFYRYFEIANLYWLNDGYKFLFPRLPFSSHTFKMHSLLVGHSLNSADIKIARYGSYSFAYGTKLRYAAIVINTTIPRLGLRYDQGLEIFDRWERFFKNLTSNIQSPQLRHSGFIVAPDPNGDFGSGFWHWLVVQKVLITSAWQGVIIGIALAFPILVIFTDDLIVGTLTTFTIACTSVSIIGVIPLAGWKLGLLESLNLTLVADLAIDHIVHVAEGYQLSRKATRKEKVEDLLHEAGISIVSGAFTTLGASVFLLFAKIIFFMQFGLFILFTVAFSALYSLGMFVILLALIGPEDDRYSLSRLVRMMKRRVSGVILKYLSRAKDTAEIQWVKPGKNGPKVGPDICVPDAIRGATGAKEHLDGDIVVTAIYVAPRSKSIDDDSISSGYESPGLNSVRFRNAGIERVDGGHSPASPSRDEQPRSDNAWSSGAENCAYPGSCL